MRLCRLHILNFSVRLQLAHAAVRLLQRALFSHNFFGSQLGKYSRRNWLNIIEFVLSSLLYPTEILRNFRGGVLSQLLAKDNEHF